MTYLVQYFGNINTDLHIHKLLLKNRNHIIIAQMHQTVN